MNTVVFLIEELEIDPAVEDQYGLNAFLSACDYGHIKIVKFLAEKYPKLINSVDEYNDNGLHLAARSGHTDTAEFLIEKLEMDPTVRNHDGRNAFLQAFAFMETSTLSSTWLKNTRS